MTWESKACPVVQHSDQMVCHLCGTVWDVNDAHPPACPRIEARSAVSRIFAPLRRLLARIGRSFYRDPDFVIGDDYLRRWWVIPRNRFFNIYLHNIQQSDDDRALHDHPWWNLTILLKGGYLEVTPKGRRIRKAGHLILRRATALHRLEVRDQEEAWTLFITGPVIRDWGFACPQGWVFWKDFVDPDDTGQKGRGCGEMDTPS